MRKTYVPPVGNKEAKIAIVGEQPGVEEVRYGKPFIGPSGRALDECLSMAHIGRSQLYITNVIKDLDAPLKKYIDIGTRGNHSISKEGYEYINELSEELKSLDLNVVIATGNIPLLALTNRIGITKWRGSVIESTIVPKLKVVPTFHPATFIPPKFNWLNKPLMVMDLQRALYESAFKEIRRTPRKLHIKPTYEEAISTLEYIIEIGRRQVTIDMDIEVMMKSKELDCIAFAWSPTEAISIPFRYQDGDYFTIEQEYEILKRISWIIQDPLIPKRGASFIFDTQFMLRKYGMIPRGNLHCTHIAQKIALPDFPAGLDFVTTMYTDIPYYKQDGKQWMKMGTGTWEEWWNYNSMDAISTAAAHPKQIDELIKQNNLETYERQRKLIKPLIYMGERGIRIDVAGMVKMKEEEQARLDTLAEELNAEVGYEINYNSPKQLIQYFYEELGIKPYKKKGAGGQYSITTDVDALKRIARRGYKAAQIMLEIRGLSKRISTYLNISKVDDDGRYRSSWKPVGTETGRLSSGETIHGTGGNQQNWPHDLLKLFLFDEGYMGYSYDLSQIENRIVAYTGGVLEQIKAFENGIDLHRLSASIIFNKPYTEVSNKDGSAALGDGKQSERYWGKKCKLRSTEVLTPSGWVGIDYAEHYNSKIAQWNTDGTISFVNPSNWYIDNYSGDIITISNQRIFQEATPDHKMPLYYNGRIVDRKISKYPKSGKYSAPLSGYLKSDQFIPSPLVRLIVATQADGYWHSGGVAFKLQKERKINRLKALLVSAGVDFNDNPSGIYISAKHDLSKFLKLMLGEEKLFGPWLLNLDQFSMNSFIDELPYWDGNIDNTKRLYFTTVKENALWVQTIAHLCGKAANINRQLNSETNSYGNKIVYRTSIRNTTTPATHAINRSIRTVENEKIYCPTVPSGYFLVRERGIISVTGNSNHATNYDVGYKTFALKNEMPETDAKHTLERIHRGYPQIRNGYHVMIQNMLKKDRFVTNLMNRRRLFLGPIIPSYKGASSSACLDTYRQAYAHFAQSSCADKVNEHGVEFIYYNNDPLFAPVELLAQVHDSVVFQIPLSLPWKVHADILLQIKKSLETPFRWGHTTIETPCDLSIGLNMSKNYMKEIKHKEFPTTIESLAEKLEGIYNDISEA